MKRLAVDSVVPAHLTGWAEPLVVEPAGLIDRRFKRPKQSGRPKQAAGEEAAVGIDLGTTNCAVAAVINGKPRILPNARGDRVSSSVVSFVAEASAGAVPLLELGQEGAESSTARVLVGDAARQQQVSNPHSTYSSTKRLIGRTTAKELRELS